MKTKLTSLTHWAANTPPTILCIIFALLLSLNAWADVTEIFGQSTSAGESSLPTSGTPTVRDNVSVSTNLTKNLVGSKTYDLEFSAENTKYVDISLNSDWLISGISTSIFYDGGSSKTGFLYIQFCTATEYDEDNIIENSKVALADNGYSNYYTFPPATSSVASIPSNAKSARIFREGGTQSWGCRLHRLEVTIKPDIPVKPSCDLSLNVTDKTVQAGESFSLSVSKAAGYDGEISYSISPAGMVTLDNGTVTAGSTNGLAVITATASTTENYEGDTKQCFVHVNNFAGTLTASENNGTVTLDWFYNLPISLENAAGPISSNGTSSSTYTDGVRTITYTTYGSTGFSAAEYKTPDNSHQTPNCKSISFQYKGNNNNGDNARVVTYAWVSGASPYSEDIVADKVDLNSSWQEAIVTPAFYYSAGSANIKGAPIDYYYYDHPSGSIAFFPMADEAVTNGTLQLRNAYYQILNSNSLTSSVKLIRKESSAPANSSDGTSIYTGAPTTYADNSGLAGHTYYYRLFVTYNDVEYASNAVSITMPGTAKKDPELSLPESSIVLKVGATYTLEPTVAVGYDGTLAYEITAGSDKISMSGTTITAEAAGTATVRVTAPETTEYNQVTANFTVTVLAAPETNLAITNVDGDNVSLAWTIPGIIDLSTARTERSSSFATNYSSISNTTSSALINNGEELDVTYSAAGKYSYNGFFFDVDVTSIESVSFDYKGDNPGGEWKGILPGIYDGSTMYWESSKGTFGLAETSWTPITIAPSNGLWKGSDTYPSGDISEFCFLIYAEGDPISNRHVYLRNLRYHCTGMTDIDHIVIMRTTGAAATDTVSGTKIYSGKISHFVDTDSKAAGLYYYTLFAVYDGICFPVESVTLDTRVFNITYKDKGDAEFSGTHETGYPTTHSNAAATALKKATKEDYIFVGWYDNAACTGDAVTSLAAGAYDADITLYARWEELSLHQPGKYQAPDGYGRVLKNVNGHDYEVYMVTYDTIETEHYGALYAGPVAKISDGYRMFRMEKKWDIKESITGDGWVEFNAYKYEGSASDCNIDEFKQLNKNSGLYSSQYARLKSTDYVQMYVQGYAEFAFVGNDKNATGDNFIVKIDGKEVAPSYPNPYEANTSTHVTRYALTPANEPHFIEITSSSSETNKFRGFSLQLPDVEHYTVTVAKNDNSYGTVSAASIPNVRAGEATYVTDNTLYIAGTTVTATPAAATAEYTYAFDNWSGVPATITEATTVTANFTRTGNDYTLTWDLNGGTVTTAGTGADVDATGTPSSPVAYGTAITAPIVAKDGYEFIGWDVTPAATMPAEAVTYTAQWYTPEHISSDGTTTLNHANVRTVVNNTNPHNPIVSFDADDNGEAETCLNIQGNGYATWKAYITRGYYQARVIYGTNGGGLKVKMKVVDPETGEEIIDTDKDVRSGSGEKHCQAIWGLDLRNVNENKIYEIKVIDAYDGTGSKPYVSSVTFIPMSPTAISNTALTHLDYTNVTNPNSLVDFDIENDGTPEKCMFIGDKKKAEWLVTLKKDKYVARVFYGAPGRTNLTLSIHNSDGTAVWTSEARAKNSSPRYETWTISEVNLNIEQISESEEYTVRITDTYDNTGSQPNIAYIEFKPQTVYIPTETRLDAENSISALTFATDLDIDDDGNNDKLMNLKNSTAEWMAQITPGVYNVSLIYGVPAWGIEVSVKLIDPTGEEEERYLSTNPSYYQSAVKDDNEQQLPHHHVGTTLCDLTGLTPGKKYKVQVADEWDGGCNLRVSHVLFTPIEPVAIPTERRLDVTNTISSPTMATDLDIDGDNTLDELMNLNQNKGNAEWIVKITQGIYDVKLTYGAPEYSIRVVAKLIDPSGEEADRYLSTNPCYYEPGEDDVPHHHTSTTRCDLRGITEGKIYKVIIEDAYGGTYGCELRVSHLEFARPVDSHTRTNLRAGDYGTICLPYAVAAADRNGAELFELEQWADNGASLTISQLNANEDMVAGRPYLFQATANTATFSYYPEGDAAEAQTYNGLIGKYEEMEIPMNEDNYIIYNNKLYLVNSANIWVGANRAYIHKGGAPMNQAPANRRRVTLGVYGTQTATDIDNVTGNPSPVTLKYIENGHLFIIRDGKTYNAQGQVVK